MDAGHPHSVIIQNVYIYSVACVFIKGGCVYWAVGGVNLGYCLGV